MAATIDQVKQGALALNRDDAPFGYRVEGDTIVGEWKIADVRWAGVLTAGSVRQDFRLVVTLDAGKQQYDPTEYGTEARSHADSGDGIGASWSSSGFKGKKISFSAGHHSAASVTSDGQPVDSASYRFDESQIKTPLFKLLEQYGWSKKGFFSSLFH